MKDYNMTILPIAYIRLPSYREFEDLPFTAWAEGEGQSVVVIEIALDDLKEIEEDDGSVYPIIEGFLREAEKEGAGYAVFYYD